MKRHFLYLFPDTKRAVIQREMEGYNDIVCEINKDLTDWEKTGLLFASAPYLLAALEDHKEWLKTGKVDGVAFDKETAIDALSAAIAKARGVK